MEIIKSIIYHIGRLKAEIVVFVIAGVGLFYFGISRGNLEVILYKAFLLAVATMLVHVSRHHVFPYIGLRKLLFENDLPENVRAAAILGLFFVYGFRLPASHSLWHNPTAWHRQATRLSTPFYMTRRRGIPFPCPHHPSFLRQPPSSPYSYAGLT